MTSSSRVYVGRLPSDIREKDLERFFKGYGRLRDVLMKNGYSFVEFDDPRDADDAVYELNGKELFGEKLLIEHARASRGRGGGRGYGGPRGYDRYGGGYGGGYGRDRYGGGDGRRGGGSRFGPPTRTDYRLRVENLSSRASWQDLKDHMRSAGEVSFADAHKQRVGEGVIEFTSMKDMKRAIEKLDGSEINGKKIRLTEERPERSSRRRSYSRSQSRSHSRSKSRSRSRSRSNSKSKNKRSSRSSSSESRSKSPAPTKKKTRSHSDDDD